MIRLSFLTSKIANAYLSRALDQVLRTAILEGVAGVPVGSWTRQPPELGLRKAEQHFMTEGVAISPEWFDLQDRGAYKAIFLVGLQILNSRTEAEELAQDVVSGFSRSMRVGGGQPYDVGKHIRDNPQLGRAIALMRNHTKHKALDKIKRRREVSLTRETDEGDVQLDPAADTGGSALDLSFGQNSQELYWELYREIERRSPRAKGKLAVFAEIIKNPGISDVGIARILGPDVPDNTPGSWVNRGAATYVSRLRREIHQDIAAILEGGSELALAVRKKLDQKSTQMDLGFGQSPSLRSAMSKLAAIIVDLQ